MATRAGQAFIAISPSFRGFKTKTETFVKTNLKGVDVEVNPVLSKKPLVMPPRKPVKVPVDVDRSRFNRSIAAIESRLDRLTRGRFLVNVGIALAPIAAPALAAAVGGAVAGAGIGAAGLAGIVSMATVGAASLKRITSGQDEITKSADASAAATKTLQGAQESLASAERSAADARISAARQVANARTAAARQITAAENGLDAAQQQLVESQKKVGQGLEDLHNARLQALRDLEDLRDRSKADALSGESAEIGVLEAQKALDDVQKDSKSSALDLRKVKLGLAEAEQRLADVRRQADENAKELADAEKGGTDANPGVIQARKALEDAKKERNEAKREVSDARREVSQARADGRREVAEAKADAARQVAEADRAVAAAGAGVAAAQTAAAHAQADQARALASMSPAQKAAAAGMDRLKKSWSGFQDATDPFVLPALTMGMDALGKGLSPLAAFMEPVSAAAGTMFGVFGDAVASEGFLAWSKRFGAFTASIAPDATQGILNLARGFGNLLTAFMPLSTDMSGGLVVLTDRFAKWTATLDGSTGFESFTDYVRENGPLLLSTFGQVGLAFIAIGKAAAPLGHDLLLIITDVAQFVAGFAAAHPHLTSAAVGFVALSSGVSAAAGPLSKMIPLVKVAGGGLIGLAKGTKTAVVFGAQFVGGLRNQSLALKTGASWATTLGSATRQGASNTLLAARSAGTFVLEQGRLALAYGRNVIASGLMTAGMIVQRGTTIAVTAATRAWAAGQWLLNAALTANPVGLVVVALVALGAGVVVAYKKVEWFRNGVDAAWGVLKSGFFWVRDNWKLLAVLLGGPIGAGVVVIVNNFDKIRSGVGKVKDAFVTAKDGIASAWDKVGDAVTNPLTTIKKALNVFFKGIDKIASFFGGSFNFRFDVDEPAKPRKPNGTDKGKDNALEQRKATGGVLSGWSPGRDIHHFTSPTGGKLHLSGGEAIMRPEWTAMVGGKPAVDAMNKMAMRGGQAFAGGGVFWPTKSKHWTTYAGHDGIDLNGPGNGLGDPYFATADGRVRYTGAGRGYGNKVELDTSGGPTVIYGHSSSIAVKAGDKVRRGQVLGRIGYSGHVIPAGPGGSHLHFGLLGEPADQGAMAVRYLAGAKMPSGGDDGGGPSFDPIAAVKRAVKSANKVADGISAGSFGDLLKKAPGTLGGMGLDWAKKKLNPVDDIADGLSNLFDDGGIAAARGLLVKNTMRPERVLPPSTTAAMDSALRNLRNPEVPTRLHPDDMEFLAELVGHELLTGASAVARGLDDRAQFEQEKKARLGAGAGVL
jgi:murein DD-endopeptidase MepM/ murein hydrolase activator NlpD